MSLSALSQQILGIALDKDWRIRCSDWEAESLSERQIQYAADDAIVAVKIFIMLAISKLKEKEERCNAAGSGDALDEISGSNTIHFQPSATDELSETDNKQSMTSIIEDEHGDDLETQQLESSTDSKELILDEAINPERTEGHSILSGLLSKLDDLSLGYMFGVQGDPTVCSGRKSKLYPQYPSFKNMEMTEDLLASSELWDCFSSLCQGIVDIPFKMKSKKKGRNGTSREGGGKHAVPSPAHARNKLSGLKPRRAPLYQNCVIEAPDGEMLSTCDKKKASWYLSRDLGMFYSICFKGHWHQSI